MMKVYLLTIVMLLGMSGKACGQTAGKLFKKYKAMPEAQWVNRTDSFRIEAKLAKEKGETQLTDEQLDTVLKGIKRLEQITLPLTDELKEQVNKDCERLKDYELLVSTSRNIDENRETEPGLPPIFSPMLIPDFTMKMYAKMKGEQVKDVLVRTDIMNIMCLVHMETDLPKDIFHQALEMDDYLPLQNEEGEAVKEQYPDTKFKVVVEYSNQEERKE